MIPVGLFVVVRLVKAGRWPISKKMAAKLGEVFGSSAVAFLA
jgi:plasmid maintenance system antidote protein VapI